MRALIFPGQGSQAVGMGSEFYNKFDLVKKIFRQADERLGYSITDIIFDGPEEKLQLTKNTQPAILTVSYSIFKVLKHEFGFNFNSFKYFAGHSLGEYSALVCSEALNFEDAIYLLHERGKAMQDAVPLGEGSMLAVLGLDINKINDFLSIIEEESGVCEIANDNANGQIILSGNKKNIELIQKNLKEKKINLTKLNNTLYKIVSNVTAKPENESNLIKKLLIDQIFSTVRWRESIINMNNLGVNNFLELGPGKVLTSMVKRTVDNVNCFSINSIADIESIKNEFKK